MAKTPEELTDAIANALNSKLLLVQMPYRGGTSSANLAEVKQIIAQHLAEPTPPACHPAQQVDAARFTLLGFSPNRVENRAQGLVNFSGSDDGKTLIIFRSASLKQETQPPSELEKSVQRWVNAKRRQTTCVDLKGDLQRQVISAERDVEESLASSPLETPAAVPKNDAEEVLKGLMMALHYVLDMGGKLSLDVQIQMKKADKVLNQLATPAPADTGAAGFVTTAQVSTQTMCSADIGKHICNYVPEANVIREDLTATGDTPQPQRQKEVIERLCKLTGLVGTKVFGSMEAYDCFCGENPCLPENYQFSEKVLKYIENKVLAATGKTPDALPTKGIYIDVDD